MSVNEMIKQFISSELIPEGSEVPLTDTDHLIDSGIIDSFGIMSLLGFLEEKFSVQISGDDLIPENFESIATISALILEKNGYQLEV